MESNSKRRHIDFDIKKFFNIIKAKRKLYYKVLPVVFVLSACWIFSEPRYYLADVVLAPEMSADNSGSNLSSLASNFGISMNEGGSDAIYPSLYPELLSSPDFIVGLLGVKVHFKTSDGENIETDYYTYLTKYQKSNWISDVFGWVLGSITGIFSSNESAELLGDVSNLDPYQLPYKDYLLVQHVPQLIQCDVDKRNNIITIIAKTQHAEVAAQMVDSARTHLQQFIINYRTSKAREDVEYYTRLSADAREEYEDAMKDYADFADGNMEIFLKASTTERDRLENEMQMKYNSYRTIETQLFAAKAKVQERTPAFTVLKMTSVPARPAGPRRIMFVFNMLALATIATTIYVLRHDIIQ